MPWRRSRDGYRGRFRNLSRGSHLRLSLPSIPVAGNHSGVLPTVNIGGESRVFTGIRPEETLDSSRGSCQDSGRGNEKARLIGPGFKEREEEERIWVRALVITAFSLSFVVVGSYITSRTSTDRPCGLRIAWECGSGIMGAWYGPSEVRQRCAKRDEPGGLGRAHLGERKKRRRKVQLSPPVWL